MRSFVFRSKVYAILLSLLALAQVIPMGTIESAPICPSCPRTLRDGSKRACCPVTPPNPTGDCCGIFENINNSLININNTLSGLNLNFNVEVSLTGLPPINVTVTGAPVNVFVTGLSCPPVNVFLTGLMCPTFPPINITVTGGGCCPTGPDINRCSTIYLRQSDFDPTGSVIITRPGRYTLCESIISTGLNAGNESALQIQSSDVMVDFNGHSITQGDTTPNINGVRIYPGLKNITITNLPSIGDTRGISNNQNSSRISNNGPSRVLSNNGALANFTASGIAIEASFGTQPVSSIEEVVIENMLIYGSINGINVDGANANVGNKNIAILRTRADRNQASGITFNQVQCGEISDSSAQLNTATANNPNVSAIHINNSQMITVRRNTCEGSFSSTGQAHGILVENSAAITLAENKASSNQSIVGLAAGIHCINTTRSLIEKNLSESNVGIPSYGVKLDNTRLTKVDGNTANHNNHGFIDDAPISCNLYIRNLAFSNEDPALTPSIRNYEVTYGSNSTFAGKILTHSLSIAEADKLKNADEFANVEIKDTPGAPCS